MMLVTCEVEEVAGGGLDLRLFRYIFVLLSAVSLSACQEKGLESRLESYNQKLSRVLEVSLVDHEGVTTASLPEVRVLQHPLPDATIDLIDFLKLGGCELQQAVAKRNSSLGKFAAPSIQLVQEYEFIQLANACLPQIDDESLKATIAEALQVKTSRLPRTVWNALMAGPEYRLFWRPVVGQYPSNVDSRVDLALGSLNNQTRSMLEHRLDLDWQEFEQALQILRSGEAGALLESWRLIAVYLAQATQVLEQRLADKPLCYANMQNPKADIFRTVVMQDFISGLQRDAAILNRRYYDLMVPIQRLEAQLSVAEVAEYKKFRVDREAVLQAGRTALKTHVAALEPLMMQCGFLPKPNTSEKAS